MAGFTDGVVRIIQIGTDTGVDEYQQPKEKMAIELIQVLKPHTGAIMSMDFDRKGKFFATCVSLEYLYISISSSPT